MFLIRAEKRKNPQGRSNFFQGFLRREPGLTFFHQGLKPGKIVKDFPQY